MTGVGSSPALAACEPSQVLLAGVSGGFPGVLPFRPTYRLARLDMNEIILKAFGDVKLNQKKKKKKQRCSSFSFQTKHTDDNIQLVDIRGHELALLSVVNGVRVYAGEVYHLQQKTVYGLSVCIHVASSSSNI